MKPNGVRPSSSILFVSVLAFCFSSISSFGQSWTLQQKLTPAKDGVSEIGDAVDIDGDYAISSGLYSSTTGEIFLLHYNGTNWEKVVTVYIPPDARNFGKSISISDNTIAIGSDTKAFIYTFTQSSCSFQQAVTIPVSVNFSSYDQVMDLEGNRLIIGIAAENNAYVFERAGTVWSQAKSLVPGATTANPGYGIAVGIEGNVAVIGAYHDAIDWKGSAFVFEYVNNEWTETSKLTLSSGAEGDLFGAGVAIDQGRIVVGAPLRDIVHDEGSVTVFSKSAGAWVQGPTLAVSNQHSTGSRVAIHGDYILQGGGYLNVFKYNGTAWQFVKTISAPARSVALTDDFLVSGDMALDKIYFFENNNDNWNLFQTYAPVESAYGDAFGSNFVASEEFLAVLSRYDDEQTFNAGVVLIYKKNGQQYEQTQKIFRSPSHEFGYGGMALQGNRFMLQSKLPVSPPPGFPIPYPTGIISYYEHDGNNWVLKQTISPPGTDDAVKHDFGSRIEMDGDWAIVSTAATPYIATVFIYHFNGTTWDMAQQIPSTDFTLSMFERFGWSVSLSGDYAVVGCPGEPYGVRSGSAYIFKRNGSQWNLHQKLVSPHPMLDEVFGMSVSVSGNHLVVAAPLNVAGQGALYTYELQNGNWQHLQKITDSDIGDRNFGYTIRLKNNRLAVSSAVGNINVFEFSNAQWHPAGYINSSLQNESYGLSLTDNSVISQLYNQPDESGGAMGIFQRPVNVFPVLISPLVDQIITINENFTFNQSLLSFDDADGDLLTYSATLSGGASLPPWLSFNPATLEFSGGIPVGESSKEIRIMAYDGNSSPVSGTFWINVNHLPEVAQDIEDQMVLAGSAFAFSFSSNTFTDADGDLLTYSATLSNGQPLPSWVTFQNADRKFTGTVPQNTLGTLSIEVTAYDNMGSSSTQFMVLINNTPQLQHTLADKNTNTSVQFAFNQNLSSFSDADGDLLTYSATLSNGASLPAWLSFNNATLEFSGNVPDGESSKEIRITASDGKSAVSATFWIYVNHIPKVAHNIEDQMVLAGSAFAFSFSSNTFTDADGDLVTYSASLSNGQPLPSWLTFQNADRKFTGTVPQNTLGTLSIKITAYDNMGSASTQFMMLINNTPQLQHPLVDKKTNTSVQFAFNQSMSSFSDADGDLLTYSATLSNGASLPTWLSFNNTALQFSGNIPDEEISKEIRITASDGKTAVSATFWIYVNHIPRLQQPVTDKTVLVSNAFSFIIPSETFHDADGDPLIYSASLTNGQPLPSWLSFTATTHVFSGTPHASATGTFSIKVSVDDGKSGTASDSFEINVKFPNREPVVALNIGDQSIQTQEFFSFVIPSGTFSDADFDALVLSARLVDAPLPSWLSFDASLNKLTGTPSASDAGSYQIMITAKDPVLASVSTTFRLMVIPKTVITAVENNSTEIVISPNPASKAFIVSAPENKEYQVHIYSAHGQKMISLDHIKSGQIVPILQLSPALYTVFLIESASNEVISKRLVVIH